MMKRIILCFIIMIIFQTNISYADFTVICEQRADKSGLWQPDYPLIYDNGIAPILIEVNGKQYFWESCQPGNHIIEYTGQDEKTYNFLKEQQDCIWTGKYYMTRKSEYDNQASRKRFIKNPVQFYDANFNLIHEQIFGEPGYYDFPEQIAYEDGKYYCKLYDGLTTSFTVSSNDMINWVKDDEHLWIRESGNIKYVNSKTFYGASILGSDLYKIKKENMYAQNYSIMNLGKYKCGINETGMYFSNDSLYWIRVPFNKSLDIESFNGSKWVYEQGEDIVFEVLWHVIKTPKQPIYDMLDKLNDTPYVIYNNTVLAFEQPPIIEDGSTLIPLQMMEV